jgi:hypothetical protein
MFTFLQQHQFWAAVILYWIFSAAVSSLPEPAPYRAGASRPDPASNGSPFYLWLFRFLHSVAGNITTVFGNKIPGAKSLTLLLMIPPLLSASACAAAHYTVHPGALNQADSVTYDTLLIAKAAIDNARADYQAGNLPDSTKAAFDALVRAYNVAHESWLTYRGAMAANQPTATYLTQLNQNLLNLSAALRAFTEGEAAANASGTARSLNDATARSHQ